MRIATETAAALLALGALFALVWLCRGAWTAPPPQPANAGPAAAAPMAVARVDATPVPARDEPTRAALPTAPAMHEAAPRIAPHPVRVRVVDGAGLPVAGAAVEAWDRSRPKGPGAHGNWDRLGTAPFARAETDGQGRCALAIDRGECFLHAAQRGLGESDDRLVGPALPPEVELVLRQPVRLRGVVLGPDGSGAGGVEVRAAARIDATGGAMRVVRPPQPAWTDGTGRFAIVVRPQTTYTLRAQDGARRAAASVTVRAEPAEVVLAFDGAFAIRGVLVASTGAPVAGGVVRVWQGAGPPPPDGPGTKAFRASSGADGRFALDVPEGGRYGIAGAAPGHASSEPLPLELTAQRPRAEAVVRLRAPASIAGVVRDENGASLGGAWLSLHAEHGFEIVPPAPVRSGGDGSFRFTGLAPEGRWTIACRPDPARRLEITKGGIASGREDVELVITAAETRGSSIVGAVTSSDPVSARMPSGMSGEALVALGDVVAGATLVRIGADGEEAGPRRDAVVEEGRYAFDDLCLGATYRVTVTAPGHVSVALGPITTTAEQHMLNAHLRRYGTLVCKIAGPAHRLELSVQPVGAPPVFRLWQSFPGIVDDFPSLAPGRYEVIARRDGQTLAGRQVDVPEGGTAEVALKIAR